MEPILDEIDAVASSGLVYPALVPTLTIPDVCAALGSDGTTTGRKYRAWVEANMDQWYAERSAELYHFRCALLHEAATVQSSSQDRPRWIFARATGITMHRNVHAERLPDGSVVERAYIMDVASFCEDVTTAARAWLSEVRGNEPFETNYRRSIRVHPNGFMPHIVGGPVVT